MSREQAVAGAAPTALTATDRRPPCAVVTGGAAGIGAAIVARLLADGHDVVVLDRDQPAAAAHPNLHAQRVDLLDRAALARAAFEVAARFDATTLVHNAGAIRPARLDALDLADLDALVSLHLAAPIALAQAALPAMRARGFGRIVLIGSRAALGLPTRSAYAATKAALGGLARTWALELARDGVTVNVVAPGPIAGTDQFHAIVPRGSDAQARLAASVPVGRLGTPDDVAHAVAFLAGREASFITGQTLHVCGGASLGSAAAG